jgi:hypothetical protein
MRAAGRRLALATIGLCAALVALACTRRPGKEERETTNLPAVAELARELELPLPPNARVVAVRREAGLDDAIFAKLELAKADWRRLAAKAPLDKAELSPDNRSYLTGDEGWWDPNRIEGLRAAQIALPNRRVLNVGVDEASRPGMVTLYVLNHGT